MCGIVYVKRKDNRPAYKAVLKRYRHQKSRGQDGFGYVAIKDNKVVAYHRAPTEHEIVKLLEKEDAPEIIFHHRYPTSTPNIEEAAHPFLIEHNLLAHQYFVVHNGVIKNTKELREKHYKLGIGYKSEIMKGFTALTTKKMYTTELAWNDSESLAIETALALDGLKSTIDTEGAAAVIGIKTRGLDVVERFFYRNEHHPLMFHEDKVMVTVTTLGSGTILPSISVQRLKLDGTGYERYGNMPILTPKGYTYQSSIYPQRDKKFYEEHEWDRDLREWVPKAKVLELEERTVPNFGFASSMRRVGTFLMPPAQDRDKVGEETPTLHFEDEEDDEAFGIERLDEISSELATMSRRVSRGTTFIEKLTIDVLWNEYNDAVEIEQTLKDCLKEMDAVMESMEPTDEMLYQRERVSEKADSIAEYVLNLSNEITVRESMAERMLK